MGEFAKETINHLMNDVGQPEMASWAALGKILMAAERGQRKEGMKAYLPLKLSCGGLTWFKLL